MKKINKKTSKKVVCIIIIIMLYSFIIPINTYGADTEKGGSLFDPLVKFLCFVPDATLNALQKMFTSPNSIRKEDEYKILYSPGVIFSGTVPAFDINFISPMNDKTGVTYDLEYMSVAYAANLNNAKKIDRETEEYTDSLFVTRTGLINDIKNDITYEYHKDREVDIAILESKLSTSSLFAGRTWENDKDTLKCAWVSPDKSKLYVVIDHYEEIQKPVSYFWDIFNLFKKVVSHSNGYVQLYEVIVTDEDMQAVENNAYNNYEKYIQNNIDKFYKKASESKKYEFINKSGIYGNKTEGIKHAFSDTYSYEAYYSIENNELNIACKITNTMVNIMSGGMNSTTVYYIGSKNLDNIPTGSKTYKSTAGILQQVIAPWYNIFRKIAVVGLLSVLVYIGIRIVLSSTSAQDKAKYKAMLKNWLMAICLLFVLHYLMVLIISIVYNVNSVVGGNLIGQEVIGEEGEDILLTTLRNNIANADEWASVFSEVIIYDVVVVYSIIFTIQYVRRTIHLAFLTVIAPLITLTYPLDKIKDNKAQAFDMWSKDYIFFSLVQVLHLLIYYVLLASSIDLSDNGNWIYAIAVIGFLIPAEKIMKKMFGFEKSKSMGAMTAGVTGALVMDAVNELKKIPGKSKENKKEKSDIKTANNNIVPPISEDNSLENTESLQRMARQRQLEENIVNGKDEEEELKIATAIRNLKEAQKESEQEKAEQEKTEQEKAEKEKTEQEKAEQERAGQEKTEQQNEERKVEEYVNATKRNFKDKVKTLSVRYTKPIVSTTLGIGIGAMGATIGFAAGVAQGDAKAAFTGLTAGAVAGYHGGQGLYNMGEKAVDGVKNIPNKVNEIRETYREGAYGAYIGAERTITHVTKIDDDFRQSKAYKKLQEHPNFSEKVLQRMLDAGITDIKRIGRVFDRNAKDTHKYSFDKAIQYSIIAENCPTEVLNDRKKFIKYFEDRNIIINPDEIEELRQCIIEFK